jgi:hypothetical protein
MAPAISLLLPALLASFAAASPAVAPPTLKITSNRKFNATAAGVRLVDIDRARVEAIKARFQTHGPAPSAGQSSPSSFPITNAVVTYTTPVGVGSPPTYYTLLIDTGSSNTWVGADKAYVKTSTSVKTSNSVSVTYGSGSFSGTEYTDTVTLSPSLVINNQSIGVASRATGFDGVDGILGVGPVGLTVGTLSPGRTTPIPTVTDNLYTQGTIPLDTLGIYFQPTTSESVQNGELTFGGADSSKYTGTLNYVPVTSTYPASEYWGVSQSVLYGTSSILSTTGGIVDTGTTLVYLATDAYKKYVSATGATLDSTTGLLKISNPANLKSLFFKIGSVSYELTANAQIWPHALNTDIGGSSNATYLVVSDLGSNSGQGLDFIDGYTFLERYYTIYDTSNKQIGFAQTPYTFATSN